MSDIGRATAKWSFGVEPLPQTQRLAPLVRSLIGSAVSLEHEDPAVDRLIHDLQAAARALAERLPADPAARVGPHARPEQRAYIDHSRSIGAYNPCFPEYDIQVEGNLARGTVSFPVAYEGPPGVVHGGFLALFFDCAIQHHNCDLGQAGKTASLSLSYHRPTPILQTLAFEIERSVGERYITSRALLSRRGTVLCRATMEAATADRASLPSVWPRRTES
jgi:hypothetical protein